MSEIVKRPWGWENRFAITDKYLGKVIHINTGEMLSLQYHRQKDETLLVVDALADFPIEFYLWGNTSNYTRDKTLGPLAHRGRGELPAARAARGEERDVAALERIFRQNLDREIAAAEPERSAGGPLGGEQPQRRERKLTLLQKLQKLGSDGAGRAGDRDMVFLHLHHSNGRC